MKMPEVIYVGHNEGYCMWSAEPVQNDNETKYYGADVVENLQLKLNAAYTERMLAVRMLAVLSGYNYGLGKDDNTHWDDEWRNVVYIDLPQGQVSWHIAPHDMHIFEGFPVYDGKWDGKFNGRDTEFAKSVNRA